MAYLSDHLQYLYLCKNALHNEGGWYIGMYEFASPEYDEAVALRTEVLRKPLNMEFLPDQLAKEYADFHFGLGTMKV